MNANVERIKRNKNKTEKEKKYETEGKSLTKRLDRRAECVRRLCGMFYFDGDGDVNDVEYFWVIKDRQRRHAALVAVALPQHQRRARRTEKLGWSRHRCWFDPALQVLSFGAQLKRGYWRRYRIGTLRELSSFARYLKRWLPPVSLFVRLSPGVLCVYVCFSVSVHEF